MLETLIFRSKKLWWHLSQRANFKLIVVLLSSFGLAALAIAGLSFYLLQKEMRNQLADRVSSWQETSGYTFTFADVSLGWFSITLIKPVLLGSGVDMSLDAIRLDLSYSAQNIRIQNLSLDQPKFAIELDKAIPILAEAMERVFGVQDKSGAKPSKESAYFSYDATIRINDGNGFFAVQGKKLGFKGITGRFLRHPQKELAFDAHSIFWQEKSVMANASGTMSLSPSGELELDFGNSGGDELHISTDLSFADISVAGTLVSLSQYFYLMTGYMPTQVGAQQAQFSVNAHRKSSDIIQGDFRFDLGILTIAHEKVTTIPFDLHHVELAGAFSADAKRQRIAFSNARIHLPMVEKEGPGLTLPIGLEVQLNEKNLPEWVALSVEPGAIGCQKLLEVLPGDALPLLKDFSFTGAIDLQMSLVFDFGEKLFRDHKFEYRNFACTAETFPESFAAKSLNSTLSVARTLRNGESVEILVGPENPHFVPINHMSPELLKAVVASEDASFYGHHGFELGAIEEAFANNLQSGEFSFGGSTITMQMVKNLFLGGHKNILRKIQEIYLAAHIETQVKKERILEIYLNMAEFGPNLYGVGEASQVFFGKDPRNLTLKQAVFLGSLLPAPVPRFLQYCASQMSFGFQNLLESLLMRMLSLGRIPEASYHKAMSESLVFNRSPEVYTSRCIAAKKSSDLRREEEIEIEL